MRMTCRPLGRLNDQALAALSARMVVPTRRIGFLVVPTVISISSKCRYGAAYGVAAITCQPLVAGGALHVSDIFDKIKTDFVKDD
jgi:hypothetical protein